MKPIKYFFSALALSLILVSAAPADTLDSARKAGQVGETANGYIAAIGTPTPATNILVSTVNNGRRAEYEKVAAKTGQPLDVVEKLAAKKIYGTLPAGARVQDESGGWTKK